MIPRLLVIKIPEGTALLKVELNDWTIQNYIEAVYFEDAQVPHCYAPFELTVEK